MTPQLKTENAEEIPFIDIRAEMAKETPVINLKPQPENNTAADANTDSTGSTTQAPPFVSSPDDFSDNPVIEPGQQQDQQQKEDPKTTKSFKGTGKFAARYLEKGVISIREWADLRLEFNAEERTRLKELIAIDFSVKQDGDDLIEKRYKLLQKEWADVPFSEEERTDMANDLETFLSSIDFQLSPGSALLFSIAMIVFPRLAPLLLKMMFK